MSNGESSRNRPATGPERPTGYGAIPTAIARPGPSSADCAGIDAAIDAALADLGVLDALAALRRAEGRLPTVRPGEMGAPPPPAASYGPRRVAPAPPMLRRRGGL